MVSTWAAKASGSACLVFAVSQERLRCGCRSASPQKTLDRAGRDAGDEALLDRLVRQFARRPGGDGALELRRGEAGAVADLHDLRGGEGQQPRLPPPGA